jgi:hypothetical protein
VHVLEEFVLDWRSWVRHVLQLPEWNDFYVTNALVIVLGLAAAEIASVWPTVALGFSALMLTNATFFHVYPFAWRRGRFPRDTSAGEQDIASTGRVNVLPRAS